MNAAGQTNPAASAHHFRSDRQHRDQRHDADAVGPDGDVEQNVVVDQRQHEHADDAGSQPQKLLLIKMRELRVQRGAVDFQHADDGKREDKGQQRPVEVAE